MFPVLSRLAFQVTSEGRFLNHLFALLASGQETDDNVDWFCRQSCYSLIRRNKEAKAWSEVERV